MRAIVVAIWSKGNRRELPALGPGLTEAQARELDRLGEEATVFALLESAKQRDAGDQSATPSAMIPTFKKPAAQRGKLPGRKPRRAGAERPQPTVFMEHCAAD